MTIEELRRRFPKASDAFLRRNATGVDAIKNPGLRASNAKPDERKSLVSRLSGKEKGGTSTAGRLKIRFTVHSVRPADWDGYDIKYLQDMLCRAGILPDDNWCILCGEVISEKVHSKKEERTVIEITPCQ